MKRRSRKAPSCQPPEWLAPIVRVPERFIVRPLALLWHGLRVFWAGIRPCRFSLIMVAAAMAFLFVSDQGLDTLRDFGERQVSGEFARSQAFFFAVGAALWVYGSWYWARILYYVQLGDSRPDHWWIRFAQLWLPRLIGLTAILGLALAFYMAADPYLNDAAPKEVLRRYTVYSIIGAVAFALFVVTRRKLSQLLASLVARTRVIAWSRNFLGAAQPVPVAQREFGTQDVCTVLRYAWPLLMTTLVAALVLFGFFAVAPERYAPSIGSTPILLLAAAGWIAAGSAVDLFGMRLRFPVFTTLFIAALAFSLWNDNHAIRTLPIKADLAGGEAAGRTTFPEAERWEQRPLMVDALKAWQTRQLTRAVPRPDMRYPLFVVAAEGGGIRAAYWTALVLTTIQDANPCFADQLFALSGVSGGSLGSAVFTALLTDTRYGTPNFRCGGTAPPAIQETAGKILGEDLLSPAIAATLYPDLLQRVLPFPIAHFDRARAIEAAWENAWRRHTRSNRFAEPIDQLWRAQQDYWLPALLLNATWVETGKRLITSNLRLSPVPEGRIEDFADIEDTHRFYGRRPLALSSAVHLSARFTYVSPAGTLEKDGQTYGRAVDGGYFENSGTTTALEVLKTINSLQTGNNSFWDRVDPYVILISNDPVDRDFVDVELGTPPDRKNGGMRPSACCSEVWSPLRTLIATREARGEYARQTTAWHVGTDRFFHFGLCKQGEAKIPLGWVLSDVVQAEMARQLTGDSCTAFDNPGNLAKIQGALAVRLPGGMGVRGGP